MNSGVDARVSHRAGQDTQRTPDQGNALTRGRSERERGGRVPRREGCRRWHHYLAGARHACSGPVWTLARMHCLDRDVDGGRRDAYGKQAPQSRSPAAAAEDEKRGRDDHPDPGVIGRLGQPAHRLVQSRCRGRGDRSVKVTIGRVQPAQARSGRLTSRSPSAYLTAAHQGMLATQQARPAWTATAPGTAHD